MPIHKCPSCKAPVAKEDKRKRTKPLEMLQPVSPATMYPLQNGHAPRFRCGCGKVVILMKGVG